jgi:PAS domain S-box-containing protein
MDRTLPPPEPSERRHGGRREADFEAQRLAVTLTRTTEAALAVSSVQGPDTLSEITRHLATIAGVDAAMVCVHDRDQPEHMMALATWLDGRSLRPFSYALQDSPCRHVVGRDTRYVACGMHDEFAPGTLFHAQGFDAYAARTLEDTRGHPIGLIVVMNRAPLLDEQLVELLLRIFGIRAGAEYERLQAEQRQQTLQASYRAIFENSEDALFVHDFDDFRIVDVNPKACSNYGYTREEMLQLRPSDLGSGVEPYTETAARAHLERARLGRPVRFEWHRRNKDGSLHWDEVVLKRATIAGTPRILAFTREITERKLANEALRQSEARLRATVEAAFDCVVGMDSEGRVVEFNAAAERCFGHTRDTALGQPLAHLIIPPRHRSAHNDGMKRFRSTGQGPYIGRLVETHAVRADGSEFPVELAISVAPGPDGDIFVGYLRDITERKQAEAHRQALEAQLRQAQKMEAIGQLTGGIAHDFNNILASIMGYVVLAMERPAAENDPKLMEHLDEAQQGCRRARNLIQQMLTFSRGQRGEPRPVALAALVRDATQILRSTLPSTMDLGVHVDDPALHALVDPVQAQQVVLNLCINARDAMQGSGRIDLTVRGFESDGPSAPLCASCKGPVAGRFVELAVGDCGPGISSEVAERIFEPFFSTKAPGKGSGMGLAMVHGIVHDHGGHVLLESTPGQGAVFRVLLPRAVETTSGAKLEPAQPRRHRPEPLSGKVLLVDDEASVLRFMHELLQGWGLEVHSTRHPHEALAWFERAPGIYRLVLTDHTMPGMTGLELARQVGATVPVLLYSGYADAVDEEAARAAGVVRVLHKPVEPAELRQALRVCLEGRGPRAPD